MQIAPETTRCTDHGSYCSTESAPRESQFSADETRVTLGLLGFGRTSVAKLEG